MGEGAGARGGEAQNLKSVGERGGQPALTAIFDIVMDRVIVGRDRLKGGEMRLGHSAARDRKALADCQVLEPASVAEPMPAAVEALAQGTCGRRTMPSAASRATAAASKPSAARISRPCSPISVAGVTPV